jgi:hypothetical protein
MRKLASLLLLLATLLFSTLSFAQKDKMYHSTAGFGITLAFSSITHRPTLGLLAGVGAGVGKELWDHGRRGHEASVNDALATAAGSGGAYLLWKYALARKRRPTVAVLPSSPETSQSTAPSNKPSAGAAAAGGGS